MVVHVALATQEVEAVHIGFALLRINDEVEVVAHHGTAEGDDDRVSSRLCYLLKMRVAHMVSRVGYFENFVVVDDGMLVDKHFGHGIGKGNIAFCALEPLGHLELGVFLHDDQVAGMHDRLAVTGIIEVPDHHRGFDSFAFAYFDEDALLREGGIPCCVAVFFWLVGILAKVCVDVCLVLLVSGTQFHDDEVIGDDLTQVGTVVTVDKNNLVCLKA